MMEGITVPFVHVLFAFFVMDSGLWTKGTTLGTKARADRKTVSIAQRTVHRITYPYQSTNSLTSLFTCSFFTSETYVKQKIKDPSFK